MTGGRGKVEHRGRLKKKFFLHKKRRVEEEHEREKGEEGLREIEIQYNETGGRIRSGRSGPPGPAAPRLWTALLAQSFFHLDNGAFA